jgi:hypothetical protein
VKLSGNELPIEPAQDVEVRSAKKLHEVYFSSRMMIYLLGK